MPAAGAGQSAAGRAHGSSRSSTVIRRCDVGPHGRALVLHNGLPILERLRGRGAEDTPLHAVWMCRADAPTCHACPSAGIVVRAPTAQSLPTFCDMRLLPRCSKASPSRLSQPHGPRRPNAPRRQVAIRANRQRARYEAGASSARPPPACSLPLFAASCGLVTCGPPSARGPRGVTITATAADPSGWCRTAGDGVCAVRPPGLERCEDGEAVQDLL